MRAARGVVHGPVRQAAREFAVIGVLVVALVPTAAWASAADTEAAHQVLTITAAAVGAVAAILADLSARLREIPRVGWSGAAFAVYSLLLIPSTTLRPDGPGEAAGLEAARLVAYVVVLVLLLLAISPARRGGAWGGWAIAGGGTVLALLAAQLVALAPSSLVRILLDRTVGLVALAGWCWVAVVYADRGIRLNRPPLWRIGCGVAVLAAGQIFRIGTGTSLSEPNPGFAALRLLGLAVIAVAVVGFWLYVMRGLRADRENQAAELRTAAEHLRRAAESGARRDHELRNGIGGLVGITALLGAPQDEGNAALRSAVLAELGRLSRMVESGAADVSDAAEVRAVLRETAALHRAHGIDVTVDAPDELHADVPDGVLRQVLANLLANAERHAAGSPVELVARREGTVAVVEVRDHGPGVPPGREEAMFEAGARDEAAGGVGLGLHISRELLAEHGGTLDIRPADPNRPGCVAVLTFVATERTGPAPGSERPDDHRSRPASRP